MYIGDQLIVPSQPAEIVTRGKLNRNSSPPVDSTKYPVA
jgi:hypothetical protein